MLLKLYSYGKQELLQSLQHHQSVITKNQLTPKSSLKYKERKKLEIYWDANGPEDAAAKLNPQLDLIFQYIL